MTEAEMRKLAKILIEEFYADFAKMFLGTFAVVVIVWVLVNFVDW